MIPKVFHRYWTGSKLPEEFHQYGLTWQRNHPAWEIKLWDDETLPELHNYRLFEKAAKIAPRNVGQFRADIVRYELLFKFGGVWIDTDFESLKPIDQLLEGVGCFVAWEVEGVWANNAIMGAVPEHPFIRSLIARLGNNVSKHIGSRPNVLSGPQFLTGVLAEYPGVKVFPKGHFYPYLWNQLSQKDDTSVYGDAYAVHHWANARRRLRK